MESPLLLPSLPPLLLFYPLRETDRPMEVQENILKLFFHLPSSSSQFQSLSLPSSLSSFTFLIFFRRCRQLFSRKREKNKKVCHDLSPLPPSPFAAAAAAAVAASDGVEKERKTCALMNQNDIGRQHRQTYNFSPSVPLPRKLPPSLPLFAHWCVYV